MRSLARCTLWVAVAVAPLIAGDAAAEEAAEPRSTAAPQSAQAPQPPAAAEPSRADGDAGAGPSVALGIAGIGVGVAGIVAGVGLLFAGADQKSEAKDLTQTIQTEMPGSNQCGGPKPHASCEDLASAADKGTVMTTAGYLLFVGGAVLALSGGLYLGVGGDRTGSHVAIQIAPEVGPGHWGATVGGTF